MPPGLFLGDYMGLTAMDDAFRAVYVTTNAALANPTTFALP